jgi:hypothetical protein
MQREGIRQDRGEGTYYCRYAAGEVVGDMAGDSSARRLSLVAVTMVKGAVELADGAGFAAAPFAFGAAVAVLGGVVSESSSGMVGQYVLRTCLRAGRRMGFERKKSMPESRHSYVLLACAQTQFYADMYLDVALFRVSGQSDNGS